MNRRANRRFFACDASTLARRLIGQVLVRKIGEHILSGRIVETEAYAGVEDAASHAFRGRITARNGAMFANPGVCYVYFTYGMHFCFNLSCAARGEPQAVLIRALEPIEGLDRMRLNRGRSTIEDRDLCKGPANLTKALAIDREHNELDSVTSDALYIRLVHARILGPASLINAPRVGISPKAGTWRESPLRWYLRGSPSITHPI